MNTEKRKVLLFGVGVFEKELLRAISRQWATIAVDMSEEKIKKLKEELPGVEYVVGDASSILTWKKLNVQEIFHVITTVHDTDVNLEVCRIVREALLLDIPITLISYAAENEKRFEPFHVTIIKPIELGINFVLNKLEKNYTKAGDIGLRKGEIIEVPILAKSHLVDRPLKLLRPSKWHVAAIYRNGQMIVPTGDTHIEVKDRVVLLGEPKVLENLAGILLKGEPQFPLQFGSVVAFPVHERFQQHLEELSYLKASLRVRKLAGYIYRAKDKAGTAEKSPLANAAYETTGQIDSLLQLLDLQDNIGLLFIPVGSVSFIERRLLKVIMQKANKPLLLSQGYQPYQSVIASLNCPDPTYALELGIDISRLCGIPFHAIYVSMPQELRSAEEEAMIKERYTLVSDFESIYKNKIPFAVMDGNPVKETLGFLREHAQSLLVLLYDKKTRFALFQPHLQYLIAKNSLLSTLLIPVEAAYES